MKRVFVTGADGFIGSHLVEQLVKDGYEVKALVYYNSFQSYGWLEDLDATILKEVDIHLGDVRDDARMEELMNHCESVYHLAALIAIPYSYAAPKSYIDTNVIGTYNVLQAARKLGTKVIHTSTSEVYGTAQFVPITETHPLHAQSPYAASKIAADQLAMSFHYTYDVPVSVVRPFNTYGPRQSNRAVIPTIITQITSGVTTIELGALSPTRDFNYVADTVAGFIAAEKSTKSVGEVINLASQYEISIEDTAKLIAEVMNVSVDIVSKNERIRPAKSEVERLFGDGTKAKNILNWEPQFGGREGFKKGLEKMVHWFTNPNNVRKYKSSGYQI